MAAAAASPSSSRLHPRSCVGNLVLATAATARPSEAKGPEAWRLRRHPHLRPSSWPASPFPSPPLPAAAGLAPTVARRDTLSLISHRRLPPVTSCNPSPFFPLQWPPPRTVRGPPSIHRWRPPMPKHWCAASSCPVPGGKSTVRIPPMHPLPSPFPVHECHGPVAGPRRGAWRTPPQELAGCPRSPGPELPKAGGLARGCRLIFFSDESRALLPGRSARCHGLHGS